MLSVKIACIIFIWLFMMRFSEGNSAPGTPCIVDASCASGVCRKARDSVLDQSRVCCNFGTTSDCQLCAATSTGIPGTCLSYGICTNDTDCLSGICRQGNTLLPGVKACCNTEQNVECAVCSIYGSREASASFNPATGGLCIQQELGEPCTQYDDECTTSRCIYQFLGGQGTCCSDVAQSCSICGVDGNCTENSCFACVSPEVCISGFTSSSEGYGCCKESEVQGCVTGCNLNGNCIRAPAEDSSSTVVLVAVFIVLALMISVLNIYIRWKYLMSEENQGTDPYNLTAVRVLEPDLDAENTRTVSAAVVSDEQANDDFIQAEIVSPTTPERRSN